MGQLSKEQEAKRNANQKNWKERRQQFAKLLSQGLIPSDIAKEMGITRQRACQLREILLEGKNNNTAQRVVSR